MVHSHSSRAQSESFSFTVKVICLQIILNAPKVKSQQSTQHPHHNNLSHENNGTVNFHFREMDTLLNSRMKRIQPELRYIDSFNEKIITLINFIITTN